jgi:hypothetical protein
MTRLLQTVCKAGFLLVLLALVAPVEAQWRERRARPIDRGGVPDWTVDPEVPRDVFTFVRLRYTHSYTRGRWGGRGGWQTDWPDADLNLSFRLHEMTSLRVEPDVDENDDRSIRIEDERLFDYPFVYIVEPGSLLLSDEEAAILRKYLLGGGFLMLDDFWGVREGEYAAEQLRKVFPDRELKPLTIDHPVFHMVFDLKEMPQVPNIGVAWSGRYEGITWERPDAKEVDYRAIHDDKGRMMVIFCHNTDNGDGWEREGEDDWYFHEFSEKKAYPLMINILFYAMTH